MSNLTDLTIASARAGLDAGDFSARELAAAHIAAMADHRTLNAFITETPEVALAAADAADKRRAAGQVASALDGVPIAMKDLFCTADVRTTAGSHILEPFIPPYESTVSAKLKAAAGPLAPSGLHPSCLSSMAHQPNDSQSMYFGFAPRRS